MYSWHYKIKKNFSSSLKQSPNFAQSQSCPFSIDEISRREEFHFSDSLDWISTYAMSDLTHQPNIRKLEFGILRFYDFSKFVDIQSDLV